MAQGCRRRPAGVIREWRRSRSERRTRGDDRTLVERSDRRPGQPPEIGKAADVAELYIKEMREDLNEEHKKFTRTPQTFNIQTDEKKEIPSSDNKILFKTSQEFDQRVAHFRYGSGGAKIAFVELLDMNDEV